MIRVEGLTKDYGPHRAIDQLHFEADRGEILGFLGPNAAGKTTTMRILAGYMPPTSGKATVAGYDVVEQSLDVRRRVGYLPETVPLYPDMTAYDYLRFMADLRKLEDADERVVDVLEVVSLEERSHSYIGSLSKGLRQRVGLAQALLHEPEVLILDEPTIGLDPEQIIEVRNLIRGLGRERTVLLSTHILSEAQQICNRVVIINKGLIIAEDTPEQLQARLTGSKRVIIRISADSDGIEKLIKEVPGVKSVKSLGRGSVEFESTAGQDLRADVARKVINAGFDLIEMRPIDFSLEDIFLQLTREDPSVLRIRDEISDDNFNGSESDFSEEV